MHKYSTVINSDNTAVFPLENPDEKEEPEASWLLQRRYVHQCVTLSVALNLATRLQIVGEKTMAFGVLLAM